MPRIFPSHERSELAKQSGLGFPVNAEPREGLSNCLSSFCAGVQRKKASAESPTLVVTPKQITNETISRLNK
jgi:hypothetical protein